MDPLFQILEFGFMARGLRDTCHRCLFFKILEDKDKKTEDRFDPQPDSVIQPKARGLLHMEREFIAHHIKEDFRGLSTTQPRCRRKYSEDHLKHSTEHSKYSKTTLEVVDACSTPLRRARGLVRPRPTGLCTPHRYEEDSGYTQGRKKL